MNRAETQRAIEEKLTRGLTQGYATTDDFPVGDQHGFPTKINHVSGPDFEYTDEWLLARTGGGREDLVITDNWGNDLRCMRQYAGGTFEPAFLQTLGVTESDVIHFLKSVITEVTHQTRLFFDFGPYSQGDWSYEYTITGRYPAANLTTAVETIRFKGQEVFVHTFNLVLVVS